jgi:hypothetical protein
MSQGLQTWDANGVLRLDTNKGYAKFLGEVGSTGTSDGSISHSGLGLGTPFAMVLPLPSGVRPEPPKDWVFPTVRFSGNTLIWEFILTSAEGYTLPYTKQPAKILYGVF